MEQRRDYEKKMTRWQKANEGLKRIRTELFLILLCLIGISFLPREAKLGVLSLFITKSFFVVLGIVVAHSTRKFLLPYIDLQRAIIEGQWSVVYFVAVWYAVIIYAFAVGG